MLLDLGLMLLPEPHPDPISTGCIPFLPPETFHGVTALPAVHLAQARDVFSLGCTLVMLVYESALSPTSWAFAYAKLSSSFPGDFEDFMRQWKEEVATSTLAHLGASPGHLKDLIASMLARNPADRPSMAAVASHRAFAITGEALAAAEPTLATPLPPLALRALPFDHHDGVHAAWQRNVARGSRLALLRDLVRLAAEDQSVKRLPREQALTLLPRLQAALGGVEGVHRGPEFDAVLERLGLSAAVLPIEHGELFSLLDSDESGCVDKRELLAGLAFLLAAHLPVEVEARLVFQAFDVDGSGALSRQEVREMLSAYGVPALAHSVEEVRAEQARVEALFEILDADHSGSIEVEELLAGMKTCKLLRQALGGEFRKYEREEGGGGLSVGTGALAAGAALVAGLAAVLLVRRK